MGAVGSRSSLANRIRRRDFDPWAATRATEARTRKPATHDPLRKRHRPLSRMSISRLHWDAIVAGNDAPLIDERANDRQAHRIRRWRVSTPGGKTRYPFEAPASRTGSSDGNLGATGGQSTG